MKLLFFPYTYISHAEFEAFTSLFGDIVFYQPTETIIPEVVGTSGLDIRIPVEGNEDRLTAAFRQFEEWRQTHHKTDLSFFKSRGNTIPFFDDTSISQIRKSIRQAEASTDSQNDTPACLQARFFLQVAQAFDIQQSDLENDLDRIAALEKGMFSSLHGGEPASFESALPRLPKVSNSREDYMLKERLDAWSCLLQHDTEGADLFLTHSKAVMDYLLEWTPELTQIDGWTLPASKSLSGDTGTDASLRDFLQQYISAFDPTQENSQQHASGATPAAPIEFDLFRAHGISPKAFFRRFIKLFGPVGPTDQDLSNPSRERDTWIGLLHSGSKT